MAPLLCIVCIVGPSSFHALESVWNHYTIPLTLPSSVAYWCGSVVWIDGVGFLRCRLGYNCRSPYLSNTIYWTAAARILYTNILCSTLPSIIHQSFPLDLCFAKKNSIFYKSTGCRLLPYVMGRTWLWKNYMQAP